LIPGGPARPRPWACFFFRALAGSFGAWAQMSNSDSPRARCCRAAYRLWPGRLVGSAVQKPQMVPHLVRDLPIPRTDLISLPRLPPPEIVRRRYASNGKAAEPLLGSASWQLRAGPPCSRSEPPCAAFPGRWWVDLASILPAPAVARRARRRSPAFSGPIQARLEACPRFSPGPLGHPGFWAGNLPAKFPRSH